MPPKNDTLHNISGLPDCRQCHSSTTSFSVWTMNHTGVSPPALCASCHFSGNSIGAMSRNDILHNLSGLPDCSSCHNTTSFLVGSLNHSLIPGSVPSGNTPSTPTCRSCHNTATAATMDNTTGNNHNSPNDCNTSGCHSVTAGFNNH